MLDTLIIKAELSNPPTEVSAFRTLTMMATISLHVHTIIEVETKVKDIYYKYLLSKYLMDFVEQLVTPEEREEGVRVDTNYNYPLTIKADRINSKNTVRLLGQISNLYTMCSS